MKTPPELTPEYRAVLTELRGNAEKFIRRHAALVKKLGSETYILGRVEQHCAAEGAKVAADPEDRKAAEKLHGYKLQMVLLCATMRRHEAAMAEEVAKSHALMNRIATELRTFFAGNAPEEFATAGDWAATEAPELALQNVVAVMTAMLGDEEERARAEAERRTKQEGAAARYREIWRARKLAANPKPFLS